MKRRVELTANLGAVYANAIDFTSSMVFRRVLRLQRQRGLLRKHFQKSTDSVETFRNKKRNASSKRKGAKRTVKVSRRLCKQVRRCGKKGRKPKKTSIGRKLK